MDDRDENNILPLNKYISSLINDRENSDVILDSGHYDSTEVIIENVEWKNKEINFRMAPLSENRIIIGDRSYIKFVCRAMKSDDTAITDTTIEMRDGLGDILVQSVQLQLSGYNAHSDSTAPRTSHMYNHINYPNSARGMNQFVMNYVHGEKDSFPVGADIKQIGGYANTSILNNKKFSVTRDLNEVAFMGPRDTVIPGALPISIKIHLTNNPASCFNCASTVTASPKLYISTVCLKIYSVMISEAMSAQITRALVTEKLTGTFDSWHMINSKLVDFPKMFGLNIKKEIFPYNFYTDKTTLTQESLLEDVLKFIKEKDKEEFIKIATEVDCIEKDEDDGKIYFYHMDYAKYYCSQDVNVLAEGFIKFRGWVLSQLNMDISNYTTIASLSHNYFIDKKCYEGVTKLYGSVRDFVQKSIVGGKVMMLDNKPLITYEPVKSVDGNSLYPSAMNRIPGFLKGLPKLLKKLTKENLTKKDYYVVEVKITAVNNKSGSPCLSYVDDTGKRIWSAEVPPKNIVMEKYTLEDCVKYHEIEYEIIRGVYWNEGFNDTICNEILKLYKLRQKYQNEKPKNPIEKVYKAILNTAYGKNIIKESDSRTVFIYGEETMHNYNEKNYNKIKNALEYGSEKDPKKKCYRVEIYQNILEHTNNAHCGTMVLGMSKRIMNELSYICNLCDSKILYCDTDSAYVFKRDVENIIKKYGEVYKRDLIGTKLGQFKQDLEIKGCENVVGLRFVVKSPKIYCVELEGNKEQTQKEKDEKKELEMKKECKTRCKGVSSISIAYKAKKDFDGDEFKMMALTKGKTTYDLVADGQMRIDIPKSGGIYSKRKFKRKIKNTPFVEIF